MRALSSLCFFLVASLFTTPVVSETKTASSGLWSDPSIWSPSGTPAAGDDVVIPSGSEVLFDTVTPILLTVDIEEGGSLRFQDSCHGGTDQIELHANEIVVRGYLEMGREDELFQREALVVLYNTQEAMSREDDILSPFGSKVLAVVDNGVWEAHGAGRNPTWLHLDGHAGAGANVITVEGDTDWMVGDEIIITSTDYAPEQTERRFIQSISDDGITITLDQPLNWSHYGQVENYYGFDVDMRAEVGNLNSNLRFLGDMSNASIPYIELPYAPTYNDFLRYGAHTICTGSGVTRIEGISMRHFGQGSRLARYPVHWHHRLDGSGQYLKRSAIYDSFARSVTIHNTNHVRVEDVVAFNVVGHSVYFEDGTEEGCQVIRNLVVTTIALDDGSNYQEMGSYKYPDCADQSLGLRLQFLDNEPAGYWITNVNNTFIDNVAVGTAWGFWIRVDLVFSEPGFPCTTCVCPTERVDLPTIDGEGLVMINNHAHSNTEAGMWIKENWTPDDFHVFQGFTAYKNKVGFENYGVSNLEYNQLLAVDNAMGSVTDWVRFGYNTYKDCLFMLESDNHGDPEFMRSHPNYGANWVQEEGCSAIYPGVNRTRGRREGLPLGLNRVGDGRSDMDNVMFANALPDCNDNTNPWFTDYVDANMMSIVHPIKSTTSRDPDRVWQRIYFDQTDFIRASGHSATQDTFNPPDESGVLEGAGFIDGDGSFPCSAAGSSWLYNVPELVHPNCVYRNAYNMYTCPPQHVYRSIHLRGQSFFQMEDIPQPVVSQWSCGKTYQFSPINSREVRATVDMGQRYIIDWSSGVSIPSGVGLYPTHPLSNAEWDRTEIQAQWDQGNLEFVFVLPGAYTPEYYWISRGEDEPNGIRDWYDDSSNMQFECQCSGSDPVTYVKVKAYHLSGNEVVFTAGGSCNAECSGNPWPPLSGDCSSGGSTSDGFAECSDMHAPSSYVAPAPFESPELEEIPLPDPGVVPSRNSQATCSSATYHQAAWMEWASQVVVVMRRWW